MKQNKILGYIIVTISGAAFWICNLLMVLGIVNIDCQCFAVDSSGKLYLGIRDTVMVFENGLSIREIPAVSSRAYAFTIQENDTMLWSTGSQIYITDLCGNKLSEREDEYARTYNSLRNNKYFECVNGSIYHKQYIWGQFRIVKDDTPEYIHPWFNQIVLYIEILSGLVFGCCIVFLLKNVKIKKNSSRDGTVS